MKSENNLRYSLKFLIVILILIIPLSSIGADIVDDKLNNPVELHKWLAERKIEALKRKRAIQDKQLEISKSVQQENFDVKFYDIKMRVNDTTEIIYGAIKIAGEALVDNFQNVDIDYDNYFQMYIDSITHPVSGHLNYNRSGDVVTIILSQSINTGEQFEFTFYYHGHPDYQSGAFSWRTYDGKKTIYTLSEPYYSRVWWPCKDRADDKADSFYIAITVDTSMYAASNGTLDSVVEHGDNSHTYHYTEHYPMANYLFSLAISDYTVWYDEWVYNDEKDTMPLVNAIYPSAYERSLNLEVTPEVLDVLSKNFGLYPYADEKYGHACWLWGGAMEHQTMTSTYPSTWGFSDMLVTHEAGHQWWGDYITCKDWHHIWINEGFASYSEALLAYERGGHSYYISYMNSMAYYGSGTIYVHDTTDESAIFNSNLSYDKGAWVVHMLRGVLGETLFFAAMDAAYNSDLKYGSATTEELRDVFEEATGVELDDFFEQWIYGEYYPTYNYSIWEELSDTGGYDYFIYVQQFAINYPQFFNMPVQFTFEDALNNTDTLRFTIDENYHLFKTNFPEQKISYDLDPAGWILKSKKLVNWNIHLITPSGEIKSGLRGEAYNGLIEYRSETAVVEASVVSGSLPDGLTLGIDGILSGITPDTGKFDFYVRFKNQSGFISESNMYSIYIAPKYFMAGDINLDGIFDIDDAIFFVDFAFKEGPSPILRDIADLNNDCQVDIDDLVYLVNYQFKGGPEPLIGCAK